MDIPSGLTAKTIPSSTHGMHISSFKSAKHLKNHSEMEWVDLRQVLEIKNPCGWAWGK